MNNSPVSSLDLNINDPSVFLCTINHGACIKPFASNFPKIIRLLSIKYISSQKEKPGTPLTYKIYGKTYGDSKLIHSGEILEGRDLEIEFENLQIEVRIFISEFLLNLSNTDALKQVYNLYYGIKGSFKVSDKELNKTIFYSASKHLQDALLVQCEYYEKLLNLEKYTQFVHTKNRERWEEISLTGLSILEFEEVISLFLKFSKDASEEDRRSTLTNFFRGIPDIVEYIVLIGVQKELADIFMSLCADHRFTVYQKVKIADWARRKFRILINNEICVFGTEAFKLKSKPGNRKRIKLSFIDYAKLSN